MQKPKPPEFDPELLASIPPEKREEFKNVARRKRYLGSGLFFFMWHFSLWGLMIPIAGLLHLLLPSYGHFMEENFSQWGFLMEAFFLMVSVGFLTRPIRYKLNQNGIYATHFFFILLPLVYVILYYIEKTPSRGY